MDAVPDVFPCRPGAAPLAHRPCLGTTELTPLWPGRVPVGLIELRYPRSKYAEVAELFHQRIPDRAIVFIRADDADRHIDYVYNTPRLDAMILRARAPQSEADLHKAIALFPDRKPWLFDASSGQLQVHSMAIGRWKTPSTKGRHQA